jgi:hypothetical protein
MYTYNISKALSEIFNTEFQEIPDLSDQILNQLPEDCIVNPQLVYSNLGTIAAALVNKGKKRPEHSKLMKQLVAEGKIKLPISGAYKPGHKHSEETRKKIGKNGGAARLGKKRGKYKKNPIDCPSCGKHLLHASAFGSHRKACKGII